MACSEEMWLSFPWLCPACWLNQVDLRAVPLPQQFEENLWGKLQAESCPCSRMAYNKCKNVEAAQKLLNQGKVAKAIAEYQNILKYEPPDQVTLMTIAELYIQHRHTFQAFESFESLAQIL